MTRLALAFIGLASTCLLASAHADLVVPLRTESAPAPSENATLPPPAPEKSSAPKAPTAGSALTAAKTQGAAKPTPRTTDRPLASRSLLPNAARQIGVARRGAPVLPPVEDAITAPAPPPQEVAIQAFLGRAKTDVNVFRLPDPQSTWLGGLSGGQSVAIISQWNGWWAIVMGDGSQGYVPQSHVELLPFAVRSVRPTDPAAMQQPAQPEPVEKSAQQVGMSAAASALIKEAQEYLGTRYVWGGNTRRGVDCSGLVKNCFATLGIALPRRASEQAQIGMPVAFEQLQPGDRLYFSVKKEYDHTGIYLGDGYFIHASSSQGKVAVDHLSTALYARTLSAARR